MGLTLLTGAKANLTEVIGVYRPEIKGVLAGLRGRHTSPEAIAQPKAFQVGGRVRDYGFGVAHGLLTRTSVVRDFPVEMAGRGAFGTLTRAQRLTNRAFNGPSLKRLEAILAKGDLQAMEAQLNYNLPYLCTHETEAVIALLRQHPEAYATVMQIFLGMNDDYDFFTNPTRSEGSPNRYLVSDAPKLLAAVKLMAAFDPKHAKLAAWRLHLHLDGASWPTAIKTGFGVKLAGILESIPK